MIGRPGKVLHGVCDALKRAGGTAQALEGEVQRAAVMGLGHKQAQRVGGVLVEHVLEREEVAQRLAHLLAVDQKHARVHPMVGELAAPGALGLGALVLMMGELQVGAAAVDVDGHAQIAVHHGSALGVPAGTARAPRRVPRGLAGLCSLPQGKVERVALLLAGLDARTHEQIVDVAAGNLAVGLVGTHGEVHVALRLIGVAAGDERLDHLDHRKNLLRGAGANVRLLDTEALHDLDERVGVLRGNLVGRNAALVCALDDLVVDVGEVLGERDVVAALDEPAADDVERKERAGVSDVDVVVDRGAADIHGHLAGNDRLEVDLAPQRRVVELHGACVSLCLHAGKPRILIALLILRWPA